MISLQEAETLVCAMECQVLARWNPSPDERFGEVLESRHIDDETVRVWTELTGLPADGVKPWDVIRLDDGTLKAER
jgi:hypothetical protein